MRKHLKDATEGEVLVEQREEVGSVPREVAHDVVRIRITLQLIQNRRAAKHEAEEVDRRHQAKLLVGHHLKDAVRDEIVGQNYVLDLAGKPILYARRQKTNYTRKNHRVAY